MMAVYRGYILKNASESMIYSKKIVFFLDIVLFIS